MCLGVHERESEVVSDVLQAPSIRSVSCSDSPSSKLCVCVLVLITLWGHESDQSVTVWGQQAGHHKLNHLIFRVDCF